MKKIIIDNRLILFTVMMVSFLLWLGLFAGIIFYVLGHPDRLDPAMGLFTGLSLGSITMFFVAMLTLSWQFYFRKREKAPGPAQPPEGD